MTAVISVVPPHLVFGTGALEDGTKLGDRVGDRVGTAERVNGARVALGASTAMATGTGVAGVPRILYVTLNPLRPTLASDAKMTT